MSHNPEVHVPTKRLAELPAPGPGTTGTWQLEDKTCVTSGSTGADCFQGDPNIITSCSKKKKHFFECFSYLIVKTE